MLDTGPVSLRLVEERGRWGLLDVSVDFLAQALSHTANPSVRTLPSGDLAVREASAPLSVNKDKMKLLQKPL